MSPSDQRAGDTVIAVGARVRLSQNCPWPERDGCEGVVVAPPVDGTYPQPSKWEVLVLLDADPLDGGAHYYAAATPAWSCCIGKRDVEVIG